jgi:hypothetical protein
MTRPKQTDLFPVAESRAPDPPADLVAAEEQRKADRRAAEREQGERSRAEYAQWEAEYLAALGPDDYVPSVVERWATYLDRRRRDTRSPIERMVDAATGFKGHR